MEEANSAVRGEQLIAEVLLLMHSVYFTQSLSLSIMRYEHRFGQGCVPFCPRLPSLFWKLHSIKHLPALFFISCSPGAGCPHSRARGASGCRQKKAGPAAAPQPEGWLSCCSASGRYRCLVKDHATQSKQSVSCPSRGIASISSFYLFQFFYILTMRGDRSLQVQMQACDGFIQCCVGVFSLVL